jgi:hypothetical protein
MRGSDAVRRRIARMSRMERVHRVPRRAARQTDIAIEEIYDETNKPLPPSERLRLATLIVSEIPPQSVVDIRDAWNEQDMRDVAAFSARLFEAGYPRQP